MILASAAATALLSLASCDNQGKFTVTGEIANAQDSMLYLENVGLEEITPIDSVQLGADGQFTLKGNASEAPEFYRLRIDDQIINLSVDSTETISIKAQYPQMATEYEVSGSDNCQKIKELSVMQIRLHEQAVNLESNTSLTRQEFTDSLQKLLSAYKDKVKTEYIFQHPDKPYSYFALFQTLGRYLIFDPHSNRDDIKVFAAVATSWDTYYPGALRGQNLHNIAIEGMKNVRIMQANEEAVIPAEKVEEAGVIDILLPDNKGQQRRLSDLKGQVVLLDFHLFSMEDSPKRILMLRELYNKYHAQGLEIYQISFDADEHFWKQTTAALPWISVRDADGIQSDKLIYYNVPALPEYFLIDRGNNLVKRSQQMSDVDAEIRKLL